MADAKVIVYPDGNFYISEINSISESDFEIFISPDLGTPFTAYPTNDYTDGVISFFIPPTLDGLYLIEAKAYVDTPTSSGDVEVGIYNRTQSKYGLSVDGSTISYLTITTGNNSSSLASTDGVLTTLQYQEDDRVWFYAETTDGVAMGLKVWVKFGPESASGANTPVGD